MCSSDLRERFDDGSPMVSALDFLSTSGEMQLLVAEPDDVEQQVTKLREQLGASYTTAIAQRRVPDLAPVSDTFIDWSDIEPRVRDARTLEELSVDGERATHHVRCQPSLEFHGRVQDWVADVREARQRGDVVLLVAATSGRAERTQEILKEYGVPAALADRGDGGHAGAVLVTVGSLSRGFRVSDAGLQVYAETDVFDEERHGAERQRSRTSSFLSDLRDLKVGDLIVHVDHGIGEFVGLKQLEIGRAHV